MPKDTKNKTISYKDAGVDIEAGEQLINRIKPFANQTKRKESIGGLGGFGSLFEIPEKFKKPVLVSGTDGVGTKLKLAFDLNKHAFAAECCFPTKSFKFGNLVCPHG